MKKTLTLAYLTMLSIEISAQIYQAPLDPSPTSPEVAGFKNYINFTEVSNSGRVGIEASIYELKDRDLTLPISLSYDHTGIQVDSRATWVGTGWNLQTGGAITREVKDLPDDARYKYYSFARSTSLSTYIGWLNANNQHSGNSNISLFPDTEFASSYTSEVYKAGASIMGYDGSAHQGVYSLGVRDKEPDIFTVSINGESFKFLFNEQGEIKKLGINDYKITVSYSGLYSQTDLDECVSYLKNNTLDNIKKGESCSYGSPLYDFIVVSPSGYKYHFEEAETMQVTLTTFSQTYLNGVFSEAEKKESILPEYTSAWHLTKIESPVGNILNLDYKTATVVEKPAYPAYVGHCKTGACDTDENRSKFKAFDDATAYDKRHVYTNNTKYVNSIWTDNVQINFHSTPDRLDLPGALRLNEIEVIYKPENKTVKRYAFDYDYTTSGADAGIPVEWTKRLFLNEIKQVSANDELPMYKFDYNTTILAHRYSYEQDFWGYYNDNDAQSLIPALWVYPEENEMDRYRIYEIPGQSGHYLSGADRTVNSTKILAGTLEKINFPSGGTKVFEFEPNTYFDPKANQDQLGAGLRIKSVTFMESAQSQSGVKRTYEYNQSSNPSRSSGNIISPPIFGIESGFFLEDDCFPNSCSFIYFGKNDAGLVPSEYDKWNKYTKRSSYPFNRIINTNGLAIAYSDVTEMIEGNGKTVHEYYLPRTYQDDATNVKETYMRIDPGDRTNYVYGSDNDYCPVEEFAWGYIRRTGKNIFPYPIMSSYKENGFEHGRKKTEIVFSESGQKLLSKEYEYIDRNINEEIVYGLVTDRFSAYCSTVGIGKVGMAWAKYELITNADAQLKEVVIKEFDQNDDQKFIAQTTQVNYPENYTLPREQITIYPDGTEKKIENRYVFDICTGAKSATLDQNAEGFWLLFENYAVSYPIEVIQYLKKPGEDFKITGAKLNLYAKGSIFEDNSSPLYALPYQMLSLETCSPITVGSFTLANLINNGADLSFEGSKYVLSQTFNNYDNYANLKRQTRIDGIVKKYTWGYNNSLVIQASLNDQMTTSYQHLPLFGITSQTDSNGRTTYYEYDDFGRLKLTKKHDGSIVQKYDYHYQGEEGE